MVGRKVGRQAGRLKIPWKWGLVVDETCVCFRYNYCKENLTPYLKKVGFNPAKDVNFMPVSGLTGSGLLHPVGEVAPWFT